MAHATDDKRCGDRDTVRPLPATLVRSGVAALCCVPPDPARVCCFDRVGCSRRAEVVRCVAGIDNCLSVYGCGQRHRCLRRQTRIEVRGKVFGIYPLRNNCKSCAHGLAARRNWQRRARDTDHCHDLDAE